MNFSNNHNGYKVCYKEENSRQYIRYFLARTYKEAKFVRYACILYPPTARDDNHELLHPTWRILPVRNSEVRDGIWRENPF